MPRPPQGTAPIPGSVTATWHPSTIAHRFRYCSGECWGTGFWGVDVRPWTTVSTATRGRAGAGDRGLQQCWVPVSVLLCPQGHTAAPNGHPGM